MHHLVLYMANNEKCQKIYIFKRLLLLPYYPIRAFLTLWAISEFDAIITL